MIVPVLLASALLLWLRFARKRDATDPRIATAAVLLIAIGVAPVLGLLPFDFQEYSTVADHYLYLAMLGPALLVGWFVLRTKQFLITSILIVILGLLSWRQARTWHDALSIAEQTVAVNPSPGVWSERLTRLLIESANIAARQGDDASAIHTYRRVIERDPNNATALANLASVLASDGNAAEAIPLYERALRIDPSMESARLGLERARSAPALSPP